jgi:hypothetical protein
LSAKGLNHGIVEDGPEIFNGLRAAVRPGAVREQRNRKLALRVNPK